MKTPIILTTCGLLVMVSCESMNEPLSGSGFDPLQTPGAQLAEQGTGGQRAIRPGQFVVATLDNTAFYNQRPGAEAEADQLLSRGTSMKVISTSGSFFRVELDSGEVGFVPRIMVQDPSAMADDSDEAFEIYPSGFDLEPTMPALDEPTDDSIPPVIEPIADPGSDVAPEPAPVPAPEVEHVPLPDI